MLQVWYSDVYALNLPERHRFPHAKYPLLRQQLVHNGTLRPEQLVVPQLIDDEIVEAAHEPAYWQAAKALGLPAKMVRRFGLPLDKRVIKRAWASASGSYWAAQQALQLGFGANLGGGTHHAYPDRAEGFCLLNDVAISATALLAQGRINKALVLDLDVHQGNGTAVFFADEPQVFTLSVHCKDNYPHPKEASDLDVELPAGTEDEAYLAALQQAVPQALAQHKPELVYLIAGTDVLATDRLGRLGLSPQGLREREHFVCSLLAKLGMPLVWVMGGGYNRQLATMVQAHAQSLDIALHYYA